MIGFFLPAYALVQRLEGLWWVGWVVFVTSALGLGGYLFIQSDKDKPPRWYFYLLSILAFVAWAVGTSSAGAELFKLPQPEITGKLIVMAAVFLVPLVDELLTRLIPAR